MAPLLQGVYPGSRFALSPRFFHKYDVVTYCDYYDLIYDLYVTYIMIVLESINIRLVIIPINAALTQEPLIGRLHLFRHDPWRANSETGVDGGHDL